MTGLKTFALRTFTRGYLSGRNITISKLDSGIRVVSMDQEAAISDLKIFLGIGTRDQSNQKPTAALLRLLLFKSNQYCSPISYVRMSELFGGTLSATSSREFTNVSVSAPGERAPKMAELALGVTSKPLFLPWEVDSEKEILKFQNSLINDNKFLLSEQIHTTVFRNGLNRTLYPDETLLGNITHNDILNLWNSRMIPSKIVICASGIPHQKLVDIVEEKFNPIDSNSTVIQDKRPQTIFRKGCESRISCSPIENSQVAIVFEGANIKQKEKLIALALLRNAFTKRVDSSKVSFSSVSYSDSGFFSINSNSIIDGQFTKVLDNTKVPVSEIELTISKSALKYTIAAAYQNSSVLFESIYNELCVDPEKTEATNLESILSSIDSLSLNTINSIQAEVFSIKPSLVICGDVENNCYYEDLF